MDGLSGPDRATDCTIAVALDGFWYDEGAAYARPGYCHEVDGRILCPGHAPDMLVPKYTYSLDAAVALVERLYPLHEIILTRRTAFDGNWWTVELGEGREVEAPTAPLALLRALVAAKTEEGRLAPSEGAPQ